MELQIVEGRGKADGLTGLPVDVSGLTNLHRTANTPDPRDFYRVSRVILMPTLTRHGGSLALPESRKPV